MSLKFKGGYQLEFAIDSENESKAMDILASIFGKKIKREIKLYGLFVRSELVFISHRFSEDELTDENYCKLLDHKETLLIINDELSAKRAGELIQICIPVETLLKRLLIYVWSEIYAVLGIKDSEKIKIEICRQIYKMYLGDLVPKLTADLTIKNREQLFLDNGRNLLQVIDSSKDFGDLKKKLVSFTKPRTVWEQISVILKEPVSYSEFGKQLNQLKTLRDKAAHPQVILAKDIKDAQRCSKHIVAKIGEVRNNYYDDLIESINKFTSSTTKILAEFTEVNIAKILTETSTALSETLAKSINQATSVPPSQFDFSKFITNTDWNTVSEEMKTNNPEMKQILDDFEKNGTKPTLNRINNEVKNDLEMIEKQDELIGKKKSRKNSANNNQTRSLFITPRPL